MKKRTLWGPIAGLAALYAIGIGLRMAEDLRRYNRILSMSDEEPLTTKIPGVMMQAVNEQRQTVNEWLNFMMSFPGDLARYFRMESM